MKYLVQFRGDPYLDRFEALPLATIKRLCDTYRCDAWVPELNLVVRGRTR